MHRTGELWIRHDMVKNCTPLFYYKNDLHIAVSDDISIVKVNVVLINNPYIVQS